jgi:hypothetical protein
VIGFSCRGGPCARPFCSVAAASSPPCRGAELCAPHGQFRQPKIQNLRLTARRDENIRRLDVAMYDALRVRGIESAGNLNRQVEQFVEL